MVSDPQGDGQASPRVALVTGGGRGIGAAICRHLAQTGYKIAVLDLDPTEAARVADGIAHEGAIALPVAGDVSKRGEVQAALAQTQASLGPIDVLVNNAGVGGPFHRIDEVADDEWDWIMTTNVKSVFYLCRELLPQMRRRGFGRIINIASTQGTLGAARSSTYVASKHAVVGYTRSIAAEWGAHGITCNAVCPGYVDTQMGVQAAVPDHLNRVLSATPVGRIASPEEIARVVTFLAHDASGYINGAIWLVDGGITAHVGL